MTTEIKTPTSINIVRLICTCGQELKYTGKNFPVSAGTLYQYNCENCKRKEISPKSYPYMEYEELK